MISDSTYPTAHRVSIQKEKEQPSSSTSVLWSPQTECCILVVTHGPEQHREADEEMIQALAQF